MSLYSPADASAVQAFNRAWAAKYIQVDGLWYDRQEWSAYLREKRRWARDDPTVDVPRPQGS